MDKTTRDLYERYLFFKAHAGYIVGQSAVCAYHLAKAEQYAKRKWWNDEWEFTWENDDYFDPQTDEEAAYLSNGNNHEVLCCILREGHRVLQSLCGIIDPDNNYRRVIEAELAADELAEHGPRGIVRDNAA